MNGIRSSMVAGLLVLSLGCGSGSDNPPTYPVTGTVTLKGNPVAGATIIFVPISDGAKGATGTSDDQGNYQVTTFVSGDGAVPGDYMLKVFKFDAPPAPPSESSPDFDPNMSLEDQEDLYNPGEEKVAATKNNLPAKYANETTSGLKHTVVEQPTTYNIELN
ncbi:MAG: carboxypeptidase regulatory-like domain-containing protein [Planctomycetales bacterium]|nr:carboxypeptidase regulatory-like domain-containing protein [Planctomycetales bacterium]